MKGMDNDVKKEENMNKQVYQAYLDTYCDITLLVSEHVSEKVCEPFFLIDQTTGETFELHVKKAVKLAHDLKYHLGINGFISFFHSFQLIDSQQLETPLRIGAVTRTDWFDQRFYNPTVKLGMTYEKAQTTFKIWSPTALRVWVVLGEENPHSYDMTCTLNGVWERTISKDLEQVPYRYLIVQSGGEREVTDPYGVASTVNGTHSVVVDLAKTRLTSPAPRPPLKQATDAVIYEVSIRDFTIHPTAPVEHHGKYLGLAQLNYLKELGVTHLQLLPIFDFEGVDELEPEAAYNWGYNPSQYNVPEGSYATDPTDPYSRINELKKLINALHEQGLGVIMDVVYNHVYDRKTFPFDGMVSTYFYRYGEHGIATNGSGCGNDLASERRMVRKFILDSVKFWLEEYGIDGFRFDLMGLLDIETMNEVRKICDAVHPEILLYGEGWNLPTALADEQKATLYNAHQLPRMAHFNDTFREVIKGPTFDYFKRGLTLGNMDLIETAQHVLAGSSGRTIGETFKFFDPVQSINYVECHDNHTFWDRAKLSNAQDSEAILQKRQLLATAMVIFAQGIPFLHGGQEFFRTKKGVENSYQKGDEINAINWDDVKRYKSEIELVKGYLQIRKSHAAFRFPSSYLVKKHLQLSDYDETVIEYALKNVKAYGPYDEIRLFFNLKEQSFSLSTSLKGFHVIANEKKSGCTPLKTFLNEKSELVLAPLSTTIMVKAASMHGF